jgi:hypothetical protein
MMENYERTKDNLTHVDPRARLGALFLLRDYWGAPPGFPELCEQFAFADEDLQVQSGGLSSICGCYYGTHDVRMGKLLAGIVRDDKRPMMIRRIAYLGLFALRGIKNRPNIYGFMFPQEIDWQFVNSFM